MKKIEDYLPYYIGCDYVSLDNKTPNGEIGGFSKSTHCDFVDLYFLDPDSNEYINIPSNCFDEIKIVLRPLSSMTEEESKELLLIRPSIVYGITVAAEMTHYLLSKSFDLFNLIPSGLALSKSTQP